LFGILYLAGLPMASRSSAGVNHNTPPGVPAPESGVVGGPRNEGASSQTRAMRTADLVDAPARLTSIPSRESWGSAAVSAVTSAIPRQAARPVTPPPVELKATESQQSAPPIISGDTWIRGPAFSRRHSAEDFASRMGRLGFPATVRREDRRGTCWVVWIGKTDPED
jgi:hypothetical protein